MEIPINPKKEKKRFTIKKLGTGKYQIINDNEPRNNNITQHSLDELRQAIEAIKAMYDCEINDSSLDEPLNS